MSDRRLIHVIDDDESVRKATQFMLRAAGFEVRTYASGDAFLHIRDMAPGCVLLDIRMPDMDGLAVQLAMRERGIALPVIVLTGHGDVSIAVQAMKLGAVDYLEKPFEKATLLAAIQVAFERLDGTDGALDTTRLANMRIAALTPREQDVLRGLARGRPNKRIAHDLGISPRTVEAHRANLMAKLDVRSLSEALHIAFAAGLDRS
jgi:two-component system, LuxR family, response regulator FixJ